MSELGYGSYYTTKEHRVEIDRAGGGYPRMTCYTCEGATLVKQPFMTADVWLLYTRQFQEVHGQLDLTTYVKF